MAVCFLHPIPSLRPFLWPQVRICMLMWAQLVEKCAEAVACQMLLALAHRGRADSMERLPAGLTSDARLLPMVLQRLLFGWVSVPCSMRRDAGMQRCRDTMHACMGFKINVRISLHAM